MGDWTIPANSFNGTTLIAPPNQAGAIIDLHEVMAEHACEVIVVCATTGDEVLVLLDGSLDGTNFYTLGSAGVPAGGAVAPGTFAALISGIGAARYIRASGNGAKGTGGTVFPVVTTLHTSSRGS